MLPSEASFAAWVASRISVMRFLISFVDSMTFSASRRISAATIEKPRPASPAFAPSSAAFSARRSERSAISSMTSTTVPIRSTRFESLAIASSTSIALCRTFSIDTMNALIAPSPWRAAGEGLLGDRRRPSARSRRSGGRRPSAPPSSRSSRGSPTPARSWRTRSASPRRAPRRSWSRAGAPPRGSR